MPGDSEHNNEMKVDKELNLGNDFTPPTYEEWKAAAEASLKGVPFEKALVTHTYEGIDLQPIYCKEDIKDLPHLEEKPGFGYYVRGTKAEGYLEQSWEICQAIPYSLPEAFNKALKHDLEKGQTAVQLTPDRAARLGLDADKAAKGDVGAEGVSISNLQDISTALKDIVLERFPIHIDAGFSGLGILAALAAFFKKENIRFDKVKGSIDTDPLGFLVTHGNLPVSLEKAYDHMAEVTRWAGKHMPQMKTIGINGLSYHNAGAGAVQELAFALATAVETIARLMERDLTIEKIAGSMRFTFGIGPFYFMEVAKLRAARMLWAKIVEACGGSEESRKMIIHGVTSFHNQTMYDPYVNMLRTTTEAFSAVVGGVDSLQTNPFDEPFGPPAEFSRRAARNTQIVLEEEAHLNQLIDPAGGSYYVEKLTHEVAQKAWALFREIEKRGGMCSTLQEGYPQAEIEAAAEQRKKDLEKRKYVMVGTNSFADVKEKKSESNVPDYEAIYKERVQYLKEYRAGIPGETKQEISGILSVLSDTGTGNLIDAGIKAFTAGATIGEFSAAARGGAPSSMKKTLRIHRAAEIFEELRDAVGAFETETNAKPKLFLATMGPLSQHKARADFSKRFFEVGGFDVIYPPGFDTPGAAVDAAVESGAAVVVICSTDDTYPELVPPIAKELKRKKPGIPVVLAGYPKDQVGAYKQAGVDEFIYLGADAHGVLSNILKKIGVLS
jgi:methylmalonyl-CoA mutase